MEMLAEFGTERGKKSRDKWHGNWRKGGTVQEPGSHRNQKKIH
jgi:hypothetical protein